MESLGTVVDLVQTRPVHWNSKHDGLIAGNIETFLDLRLVNHQGKEKVVRIPVSEEVLNFYMKG